MQRETIEVAVRGRPRSKIGSGRPWQLTMTLWRDQGPGTYLGGTLSVDKGDFHLAFGVLIEPQALRAFLDEASSLDAHQLDAEAVLYDFDYQRVLVLAWVPLQPPVLVVCGEYTTFLIPQELDVDVKAKYPYQGFDKVQYTATAITLSEVSRLVSELRSGLDRLDMHMVGS